jgi:PAS domain S-box-containing protein
MNITIGKRILAGLALNIAFFVVLSLVLFVQVQDFSTSYRGLVRHSTAALVQINELIAGMHDQNAQVLRYVLTGDAESLGAVEDAGSKLDARMRALGSSLTGERQHQQLDTVRLMLGQYGRTIKNVTKIRQERGFEDAKRYLNYEDFIRLTENEMDALVDLVSADMNAQIRQNSMLIDRIKWAVFLMGLATVIITVLVNLRLYRALTVPMFQLMDGVKKIARGSLEYRVPIRRDDEIGMLARSFNEMASALDHAFESIQTSRLNLMREVKERKLAEEALHESEERFRVLFESSPLPAAIARAGRVILVNEGFRLLARAPSPESLRDKSLLNFVAPESRALVTRYVAARAHGEDVPSRYEAMGLRLDGTCFPYEISVSTVGLPDGPVTLAYIQDISERIQAERELKESEEKFRTLFERTKDAVCFMDGEGRFVDMNQAALELFGYASVEDIRTDGATLGSFTGEDRFVLFLSLLTQDGFVRDYEVSMANRGGVDRQVLVSATALRDETGTVTSIQGIMRDITEKLKFQEQIMRMQKMETVGALAGGLAHDFNNVLVGIMGTLSLLQLKIREGNLQNAGEIMADLDVIEQSGVRATEIVKRFLMLSQRQETSYAPLDMNRLISDVLKVCRNSFHKLVGFREDLPDGPAMVSGDKTQLEQVILNLCVNANHAMTMMRAPGEHEGGTLTVKSERIFADEHFCATHPRAASGWYWRLGVGDTGVGMPDSIRGKIFDPFFSTKGKGGGIGLGLSMVYSIVTDHHGFIDVYSQEGEGSTFNVHIPALPDDTIADMDADRLSITRGEGPVLIVDDEDMILRTARRILAAGGYTVHTAKSGAAAIELFRSIHGDIRAVVLDMVMPGMTGDEVFRELKKIDPQVRVLIASGFVQDQRAQHAMQEGARQFLQKPYTLERLLRAVHEVVTGD